MIIHSSIHTLLLFWFHTFRFKSHSAYNTPLGVRKILHGSAFWGSDGLHYMQTFAWPSQNGRCSDGYDNHNCHSCRWVRAQVQTPIYPSWSISDSFILVFFPLFIVLVPNVTAAPLLYFLTIVVTMLLIYLKKNFIIILHYTLIVTQAKQIWDMPFSYTSVLWRHNNRHFQCF